jgi:NAD(P)-dependent dehydrogenase (short-subunit alcohol dehydrogenase family)
MTAPRSVLVTGGAKRIGAAIARRLAGEGWRVVVHYLHDADQAAHYAKSLGSGAAAICADLSDPAAAEALPARAAALAGGRLDAVVNNASAFVFNKATTFTIEDWRRDETVNLLSPILIARAFAGNLPQGAQGAVVNILDQKLWNPNADFFTYTMSKIGLEGATRLLARALAPSVRVNAVAPGLTLPSGKQTDEEFAAVAGKYNLMRRPIDIEAVAGAVSFLLSNDAVTGQTILVDNGQHMVASDHDVMFRTRGHS